MKTRTVTANDDYLRLVQAFPLRVIRDDDQAAAAFTFIEPLIIKGEDADGRQRLTNGESDYLEVMSALLESYDERHAAPAKQSPIETLKFLLDEHDMSAAVLGRLLGNRSLGSNILTKKRELSKEHIRILAEHFKVSAGLFL